MYISAIEDAINGTESLSAYIRKLLISEETLIEEKDDVDRAIDGVITDTGIITDSHMNDILTSTLNEISMEEILVDSINEAVTTNVEFSNDILLSPLLDVARDRNNFTAMINRSRWNSSVDVIVDMDSTAGTLGEYASGVIAVRKKLAGEKGRKVADPNKASNYWKNRVYLNANQMWYETTMEERIRLSGKPAPYWRLLDSGSMRMASDWGGTSYPNGIATNFTGKTESKIKKIFRDRIKLEEINFKKFADQVIRRQKALSDQLASIYARLKVIEMLDITRVRALIDSYGNDLDVRKLISVLDSIMNKQTIRATAAGRIELTRRGGHTKRVRPSLSSLISGMR